MGDLSGVALEPSGIYNYRLAKDARADFNKGEQFIINALFNKRDGDWVTKADFEIGDYIKLKWVNKAGWTQYLDITVK